MSQGGTYDIKALAKAINRRRQEHNRLHPDRPIRITPAMSRILENDDDYTPYRERTRGKQQRPVANPTLRTMVSIARALNTTVGDLLGEPAYHISPTDRMRLLQFVRFLTALLRLEREQ